MKRLHPRQIQAAWTQFSGRDIDDPIIEQLAGRSRQIQLPLGDTLLHQDDVANNVFLIAQGELRAVKYTSNGHEIWLSDLSAGDLVGELAVLANIKRTSSLIASSPSTVLSLTAAEFEHLLMRDGALGLSLARQLAKRLEATSGQLVDLLGMPVTIRLHAELVRSAEPDPADEELNIISSAPSVSVLGQRIHASREATSRALSSLERRGLVHRQKARWTVISPSNF
ncbi:MAG: Crp/Fnr family transcriptional regulator [Pseudomonadota bacterium]